MQIDENDPRNVRAAGRTRPTSLEERKIEALESIADSLARIVEEMHTSGARPTAIETSSSLDR